MIAMGDKNVNAADGKGNRRRYNGITQVILQGEKPKRPWRHILCIA